jgi:hypothetical protein
MTTIPTDCTRFEDDLKAYADGELSWLRRRAVRRHLTHCASCQEEIFSMTQIADDLRTSEPADALSPTLREKILTAPDTEDSSVAERLSFKSRPALPVPVTKRPALAWVLSGAALVAWFVCYPMFGKVHEYARRINPAANSSLANSRGALERQQYAVPLPSVESPNSQTYDRNGPATPASAMPLSKPTITVRLSDREAGTDTSGNFRVVYGGFGLEHLNNGALNATSASAASNALNADPDALRQVHKEASIGIQVPNPETTGDTLNTMVQETGGYVAANNLSTGGDGLKSAELIVKVPVTQFETFLAQVAKLGSVQSKNISGEDITEKTSDADQTESVLEDDLQQSEARLKSLGAKAKWHDQEATRDLRIQLAQARARLVLLKRMAALGTITIDLSQTPKATAAPPVTNGFTGSLKANTHDALQSLVGSAGALLALVIWLLAYAPIWVPLLLIGRYALKEYRKREAVSGQ